MRGGVGVALLVQFILKVVIAKKFRTFTIPFGQVHFGRGTGSNVATTNWQIAKTVTYYKGRSTANCGRCRKAIERFVVRPFPSCFGDALPNNSRYSEDAFIHWSTPIGTTLIISSYSNQIGRGLGGGIEINRSFMFLALRDFRTICAGGAGSGSAANGARSEPATGNSGGLHLVKRRTAFVVCLLRGTVGLDLVKRRTARGACLLRGTGMFVAHVEYAMKSSGNTEETNDVTMLLSYSITWVIRVNGKFGARVDDRRDAKLWKQGT